MPPFPLPLESMLGHVGALSIYILIGFAFGYVLEISGFAISTRLAAQFYFKDMTVLKVMFTGIIVAMLALLNPLGVVLSAIFVAGVFVGADSMSRAAGVPTYIADILTATALLTMVLAIRLTRTKIRWR